MRGRRIAVVLLAGLAAVGAAGAGWAAQAGSDAATVAVALKEFKLTPSAKRAPAGRVTFVVRNTGRLRHEFVVIRTARAAGRLPVRAAKAVETGRVAKLPEFAPGTTKRLTVTLLRGHYALICNVPAHYAAGQFADFTAG